MNGNSPDPSASIIIQGSPPAPLSRTTIDKYEVIYPLEQGGMASVHVGRLSGIAGFEKLVAIKVVHPHLMNERAFLEMFLDEARLAAQIRHPNVVEIYSLGQEEDLYYMMCELVLGQNLRALMQRSLERASPLGFGQIAYIGTEVCRGLHAAHEARSQDGEMLGLVHRDVSPRNVLISYSGHVKIIDFGVAWAKGKLSQTRTGAIKGKIAYMPPEQLQGFPLDRRSDIYSVGVMLYRMATNYHPFPGSTQVERMTRIIEGKFPPPREMRQDVPSELERIILKAMAYSANDRFDTAESMAEDLEAFARSTSEPWGAAALGKISSALFLHEMQRHEVLMRAHRLGQEGQTPAASQQIQNYPYGPHGAEPRTKSDPNATLIPNPQTISGGKWRSVLKLKLMAVLAPAAVIALGALVYWSGVLQPGGTSAGADGRPESLPETPAAVEVDATAAQPLPNESAHQPEAKKVKLKVTGLPPGGVTLTLDGQTVSLKDGRLELVADGANHVLEMETSGYLKRSIIFRADADATIEAQLQPARSRPGKTNKKRDSSPKSAKLPDKKKSLRRNPYQ